MNGNNPNIVQKGVSQWAKKLSVRVYFWQYGTVLWVLN